MVALSRAGHDGLAKAPTQLNPVRSVMDTKDSQNAIDFENLMSLMSANEMQWLASWLLRPKVAFHDSRRLPIRVESPESVVASSQQATRDQTRFQLVILKVALCTSDGRYVSVNDEQGDLLTVHQNEVGPREEFTLELLDDGRVALKSHKGRYVCADQALNGALIANRDQLGEREKLYLEPDLIWLQEKEKPFLGLY
jgi:hypothetical protein